MADMQPIKLTFLESDRELGEVLSKVRTVVHFKGFGPSILHAPSQEMLGSLASFDMIEFDGDDFDNASFTFALRLLVDQLQEQGKRIPTLLAFKHQDGKRRFSKSWRRFLVPAELDAHLYCYVVKPKEVAEVEKKLMTLKSTEDQAKFVTLGAFALSCTARLPGADKQPLERMVVAWGGYHIVVLEFQAQMTLWAENAPRWEYYHARRTRGPQQELQEGLLLTHKHKSLTIRLAKL